MSEMKFTDDNVFIRRLKAEYEKHINNIFGCTFEEYLSAIPGGKKKFYDDCQESFTQGGMAALRYDMKSNIAVMDFICFMKTEDKEWFFEDFVQRAMSLGIGIRRDELVPWNWASINQKDGIVQTAANDID